MCRRVRFNKHLPTAEALGAYFGTYGRHCRTLHLGHLDAASAQVGGAGFLLCCEAAWAGCLGWVVLLAAQRHPSVVVAAWLEVMTHRSRHCLPQEGCVGEDDLAALLQQVAPSLQQLVFNQCRVQVRICLVAPLRRSQLGKAGWSWLFSGSSLLQLRHLPLEVTAGRG